MDDVRLVNREDGIPSLIRRFRDESMAEERDQFGDPSEDSFQPLTLAIEVRRLIAPGRPPDPLVHDVESEGVERPIEPPLDRPRIAQDPIEG